MIPRPPRSTRTDTLFPYNDALPIFALRRAAGISMPQSSQKRVPSPDAMRERAIRSEEHTSELQSLMRISYAVFCLKKKKQTQLLKLTSQYHDNDTAYLHRLRDHLHHLVPH